VIVRPILYPRSWARSCPAPAAGIVRRCPAVAVSPPAAVVLADRVAVAAPAVAVPDSVVAVAAPVVAVAVPVAAVAAPVAVVVFAPTLRRRLSARGTGPRIAAGTAAASERLELDIGWLVVDIGLLVAGIGRFAAASTVYQWRSVERTATGHLLLRAVVRTADGLAESGTGAGARLAGPMTVVEVRRT